MSSSDPTYSLPPFPAYPSIERYIGLGSIQEAVERIERSIQARDAISVVIGPPGTGKTLISELLCDRHRESHQVISLGETMFADSDSFLRRILHQLGADIRDVPHEDFQLALFDHLCLGDATAARLLLLVDEAQSLSPPILETIRTLTNLTRHGQPRVSIVLLGGNHLDELLIAPSLDGLRQRISTRCYLHPLNGEETGCYINQTIRNCGCDPDLTITADAISAVHHACSGLPRLINQLLTHAIEFAAQKDKHLITDQIIDQAWAELQQLPSPVIDESEPNILASEVEFGELDALEAPKVEFEIANKPDKLGAGNPDSYDANLTLSESDSENLADEYDTYDFEPDGNYTSKIGFNSEDTIEPNPDLTHDADQSTEASAVQENESTTHGLNELTQAVSDHSSNCADLPENNATSIPELDYPQLASPALAIDANDESKSETFLSTLHDEQCDAKREEKLFGSFDEEEHIDLRANSNHQKPALKSEIKSPIQSEQDQDPIELSELHSSHDAVLIESCGEAQTLPHQVHKAGMDPNSDILSVDNAPLGYHESTVDSETLEFISTNCTPTELEGVQCKTTDDNLQFSENNDERSNHQHLKIHPRHDDKDLLIIEDEVDIHRFEKRDDSTADRKRTIEYKRVLKRMRAMS